MPDPHADGAWRARGRCVAPSRSSFATPRALYVGVLCGSLKVSLLHHKDSSMRHFALSRCRLAC
ncbi:TPA: hypothetical protein L6A27_26400 [Pseudomonas aeruginosa]|nr:hypothetical protein APB45_30185 [Pseudomonas aeruginosa]PHJ32676.1 hypothetical protein CDG78_09510 [Pseudomonas paraeruginosa]RPV02632.1 hypothetical protein IPC878_23510 [Pseudomonas aeruginosa]RQF85650.1 hypothetical protein IPC241_17375 [Pseudomonas aeruginosa]HBP6041029.1 hypothetical protein [Pseudomonas aeruginosa]